MIYLDSNVFLFALLYDEKDNSQAFTSRVILKDVIDHKIQACTSFLTWDEVVFVVRKKAGIDESVLTGEKLLSFPNIKFIEANQEIITLAQDLTGTYHIRPRDAIHAASALQAGVESFLSDDSDFDILHEITRIPLDQYSSA